MATETEITADQLPAELRSTLLPSAAPVGMTEVDPLSLDSNALFELSTKKMFDPIQWAQENPERATDVAVVPKLADTLARLNERGFKTEDLPSAGEAVKAVGQAGIGIAKQLFNYGSFLTEPINSALGFVTGQGPEFQAELTKQNERRQIETAAGTEAAITGLSQIPGKIGEKVLHNIGTATGLAKPYDQLSAEEKAKRFFDALGKAQTATEISKGHGGLVGAIGGETVKELEARGEAVRPEEVGQLAAGDPLSFLLFGKAFGLAGKAAAPVAGAAAKVVTPIAEAVGKVVPEGVKAAASAISEKAGAFADKAPAYIGGKLIQGAGKATELAGKGIKLVTRSVGEGGIGGGVGGALAAGEPLTAIGIAVAKPAIRLAGRITETVGEKVASLGKQIATGEGVTPYAQLARDVLQSAPIIASSTLKGAAFDVGLAAATAETPQETGAATAFGTVLGGLHGIGRTGLKAVQGQIIMPRPWGTTETTPAYGNFANLDALNTAAEKSRPPGEVQRSNAIREFLSGAGNQVQSFLMPDAASMEKALIDRGYSPEKAKFAAQQDGMFVGELPDDAGNKQRVVFLNNVDVAPHEAFHGIQDVLGERANHVIDGLVFEHYKNEWENLGQDYARRLDPKATGDWRETVLDGSGWGEVAAAEKALRDAGNKIQAETGMLPDPQAAKDLAAGVLTKARESGAGWRDILTPEEATREANRYVARELAAENEDIAFKGGNMEGNSLPEKLARIIANAATFFGVEPLAGAKTANLGIEPKYAVVKGVSDIVKSMKTGGPTAEVTAALPKGKFGAATAPPATVPFSPEERAAEGEKAGTFADEVAARNPQTGEVLRKIASAISGGQGIKVEYRAAKGTPGADPSQTREMRRSEIEAAREVSDAFNMMPEDVRPLWEKLNFPDRVESTKNKGFQILGWSPENYAANAQKMAKFIADIQAKVPEAKNWSPYEIDPATKSFTPDGWRELYDDVQTFVKNQQAGGTGSGKPLTLPADAAAMRISVPPLREAALAPLDQTKADFINVLFNIMLPETPRVSRAGGTPGNIVAQRIARANEPVVGPRVVEPGRVRSTAEFKGFPGEKIMEVNPLRARMEQAASDAGVSFPSLIETSQRLNLDHIADVTPAPEAPVIRGVTDTLRAGFAPAAEKAVENRGREIASMDVATFKAASEQWNGGMTGEAQRIGKLASSPEDLASLQRLATEAQQRMNDAKKARDMDAVFAELAKKQFFDEAAQAASGRQFTTEAPTGQFAPKKKDEAKLLPAGADGMSKAWILPSGKIEQLGAQWHHAFLSDNPEIAKKYNLTVPPFEGNDVAGVREAALRKGFVRVNYGRNTGTLTVEARQKDWRHQKAAVEKLVEKNLDDIDNMTVHLLDETASKVVDSDSERLFRHDEDVDKMANLPFITKEGGEVRGAQFSPAAETTLSSEEFGKELTKIRAGQSGGQTFNVDGTVWKAPAEPVDVVTLASVNIPLGSAKPEAVRDALAQYEDLLNQPGIVAGVFAFSKDGKPTMSADINAVVPQEFRDNSFNFVKDNDQVSFWDAAKNEEVKTGGRGNTKLSTVDQLLSAQEALVKGEPVDVASLAGSEIGETGGLPGLEMGREFNQKAISQMSQAELKKHFPEAIVPRNSAEEIPYDIVESPLFKAAGSQEAAVKSFGRKLVEFYRENERSPELKAGEKWYSEFTPLLKKQFGKDAQIFAELLAATSPNTEPGVNFQFAFDALSNWKAGKYDKMIPKFNEGFERLADGSLQKIYERDVAAGKVKNAPATPSEATYLAHWIIKNDLIPISSSGKRFGMHSEAVLKVLARRWLSQTAGPKTQNFVKNLVGTGHDATVDVWAARTMRRLGYAGSKERWRILPANSKGVSDADFHFSQEAFREAAKEIGIKPDALQGALWFAEKKFWSDSGWGRLSLGDFRAEMEKVPALKAEFARKNLVEAPKKKQLTILDDLVRKK